MVFVATTYITGSACIVLLQGAPGCEANSMHAAQKPFGHFVRAVLLMPLYVPLFSPRAYASGTASTIYVNVLKVSPQ